MIKLSILALALLTGPAVALDYPDHLPKDQAAWMVKVVIACSFTVENPETGLLNDAALDRMVECVSENYYKEW